MFTQLTTFEWLKLSYETRQLLVVQFNITRSVPAHVENNQVVSDGHSSKDLSVLNVESLQKFLESTETDFTKLFNNTLKKLTEPLVEEPKNAYEKESKKRGRPSKRTGNTETARKDGKKDENRAISSVA